jgi:hypothetical protein
VRRALFLLLAPCIALSAPKPGDEGTPEYRAASELVGQLGHAKFAVREAAAKKLLEMSGAAIPALQAGTKSADEEIRSRSTALLPKAQSIEWGRRADAFLANADSKQKHDLPLLDEWEKLTGKPDAGSRRLFSDMVRSSGSLLQLAATDRAAAVTVLSTRSEALLDTVRVKGTQVEAPAGEVAALLFTQCVLKDRPIVGVQTEDDNEPFNLLANPAVTMALDAKETGPAFRRLVVRWAESRPRADTMSRLFFAVLAHRHPFPEADSHLIRLATGPENDRPRWVAIEALGRSGSKPAVAKLTELLSDKTAIFEDRGKQDARHQIRDCALAALAKSQGKNPTAYGLTSHLSTEISFGGDADVFTLRLFGFNTAADRERGIKKWQDESAPKK